MDDDPKDRVEVFADGLRWRLSEAVSLTAAPQYFCQGLGHILREFLSFGAALYNPEWRDDTFDLEKALACEHIVVGHLREQMAIGTLLGDGYQADHPERRSRPGRDWWGSADLSLIRNTADGPGTKLFGVRVWRPGVFLPSEVGIKMNLENGAAVMRLMFPPAPAESTKPAFTRDALSGEFRDRVAKWPISRRLPNEAEDQTWAAELFADRIPRDTFREIRKAATPAAWRKQGPRR